MKGKSYTVTSKGFTGILTYEFDLSGLLIAFKTDIKDEKVLKAMARRCPANNDEFKSTINELNGFVKNKLRVKETPVDLSFERFWNLYSKKASKKKESLKQWENLSENEKIKVLLYIPVYKSIKKQDGTELLYANTFLTNKNWE